MQEEFVEIIFITTCRSGKSKKKERKKAVTPIFTLDRNPSKNRRVTDESQITKEALRLMRVNRKSK